MQHHYLKTLPEYFNAVKAGDKTFEVRFNDRNFQVGDTLHLEEYVNGKYTGQQLTRMITYILNTPDFCKEGFVVIGMKPYYTCTRAVCPLSTRASAQCTLTEKDCPYFTKELHYDL